jgi:hypothetical protein
VVPRRSAGKTVRARSACRAFLGGRSTSPLGGSNVTEDTSLKTKTVTFDKSKLLSVTKDGLEHVDDQGCRCAIDFRTCRENFPDPNYVAYRDIDASPPHITFATNPPTRFVFPKPRTDRGFLEFQMRLFYEAGVQTFDMT